MRTEDSFNSGDTLYWIELAKRYGIRLPLWRMPCTTGGMRKYLKKLNVPVTEYLERNNEKNLREFSKRSPDWPLRAWVGIQLEWKADDEKEPVPRLELAPIKRRKKQEESDA